MNAAVWIFLQACVCGAVSGLLYVLVRLLQKFSGCGKRLVFWLDGSFFLLISVWLFRFTLELLDGRLRFFVAAGWFLGGVLCYCTVGSALFSAAWRIMQLFRRIFCAAAGFCRRFLRHFKSKKTPSLGHSD